MRNKKQLIVLLAAATWISVAVAISTYVALTPLMDQYGINGAKLSEELLFSPNTTLRANVSSLLSVASLLAFATSLPAILFGSVLFLWFGRKRPEPPV
ncbi:MAG TPA: hypothetical protein VIH89_16360 [Candidatus Sulfotelmatobacter sp.]